MARADGDGDDLERLDKRLHGGGGQVCKTEGMPGGGKSRRNQ
jgi:hypothetical protein